MGNNGGLNQIVAVETERVMEETEPVEQLDVAVWGGVGEEKTEIKDDSLGWGLINQ